MMKNLHPKYHLLKEITINLASFGIPLSFLAGFLIGAGNWKLGHIVMIIYIVVDNVTGRLWFKVLEMMRRP